MSDNPLNTLSALSPSATADDARELAAELVRSGGDVNALNAELTKRGAATLTANSLDMAELARDRLMRDPKFLERFNTGDPSAVDQVNAAALRISQAKGKLMDRPPVESEYDFNAAMHRANASGAHTSEDISELSAAFPEWAHGLQLPKDTASALAAEHVAFVARASDMTEEQADELGDRETAILHRSLGETAETQIKEASVILTRVLKRNIDLAQVVKTNGANVAMRLLFHAQDLKGRGL